MNKIDNFLKDSELIDSFWDKYINNGEIKMSLKNVSYLDMVPDSFTSSLPRTDFLLPLIRDLKNKIDKNFVHGQNFIIRRWYINIHPTGYDGTIHTDNPDNLPTFLYCLTPGWNPDWGGEFITYDANKEATDVCSFKSDRLIIFNGSMNHRGVAPTRLSSLLRITIAFQTNLLENTDND